MICAPNVAAETIRWGARQRVTVPAGGTSDVAQFIDLALPAPTAVLIALYAVVTTPSWDVQVTFRLRIGIGSANWEEIQTHFPGPQPILSDVFVRPLRTLQVAATLTSSATVDRTVDLVVMAAPLCCGFFAAGSVASP
jgi:hypothetical protein